MHSEGEVAYQRLKQILSETRAFYKRKQYWYWLTEVCTWQSDIVEAVLGRAVSPFHPSHLVSVVVPAIGTRYDDHPVFPTVWLLGEKCRHQAETQAETQAEQGEEGWRIHVYVALCGVPGGMTGKNKAQIHS